VISTLVVAAWQAARRRFTPRHAARVGLAIAMAVAGVTHWTNPTLRGLGDMEHSPGPPPAGPTAGNRPIGRGVARVSPASTAGDVTVDTRQPYPWGV
jgi:hypothetical protein